MNSYGMSLKIIVVGQPFTGKTSFVKTWVGGQFSNTYKATIISDFGSKVLKINDITYTVQLWDIGGQDRNIILTKMFCKDCHGAIILCAAEDDNSLQETKEWIKLIENNLKFMKELAIPILLIQNKSDLITDIDENEEKLNLFCKDNDIKKYFITSAKTGHNINESIEYLLTKISEIIGRVTEMRKNNNNISIMSNRTDGSEYKKKQCC